MSTSAFLNPSELQKLLTFNYIGENYGEYFPFVLSNLCFEFVNEYIVIQIPQNYLKLLSCDNRYKLRELPKITTIYEINNNIIFELDTSNNDLNNFCIRLKSIQLPDNTEYLRILVQIYCNQTNYQYIKTHKFIKGKRSIRYLFEIYPNEVQTLKELDCTVHIELIEIKYKNISEIKGFYSKQIKIKKKCQFYYNLDKDVLDKHKMRRSVPQFYSNLFDNTWCITSQRMTPFYIEYDDILEILCLRLKLLILPFHIKSIKVDHSIKCLNNNKIKRQNDVRIFKYDDMLYHHKDFCIPFEFVKQSLSFKVSIQIIEVKQINGSKINPSNWNQFGII